MTEIIKLPTVFQTWDKAEAIIRKHLKGQIPKTDEDRVVSRFKEIFNKLPSRINEISICLDGLEHLPEQDMDVVRGAIGSAVDQILEEMQIFTGRVLGEIFALVLEIWRSEDLKQDKIM